MELLDNVEAWHVDGAGNTFAALDARFWPSLGKDAAARLAREMCSESGPFGLLDGVLLLEPSPDPTTADVTMHYRNRDGSRAEMCGNGLRCFAVFAGAVAGLPMQLRIGTDAGLHRTEVLSDGQVRVTFPGEFAPPHLDELFLGGRYVADLLNTGVPHLVLWVDALEGLPFLDLAGKLRHTPELYPYGANINAAQRISAGNVRLRTYERGVEGETLACGTGVVAAALCHAAREEFLGECTIAVEVRSGATLTVGLSRDGGGTAHGVTLTGPAVLRGSRLLRIDPASGAVGICP